MAKTLLMDELHISIYAPRGLPDWDYEAIYRTLKSAGLQRQIRTAVKAALRRYPALEKVRIVIAR